MKHEYQQRDLSDFPLEVIERMLEHQELQGNLRDVTVFQKNKSQSIGGDGFYWYDTSEGYAFWFEVITNKNFDLFFNKYPKKEIREKSTIALEFDNKYVSERIDYSTNEAIYKITLDKEDGIKNNEGKMSYAEISPLYISLMAQRMNKNKDQYPTNNWKKNINVISLLDAMERHVADLKQLLNNEPPIHNKKESAIDHLAAIGCDAQMIVYQLTKKQIDNDN